MNVYGMCGAFAAGVIAAGALVLWWDWKHPSPVRWDWIADYEKEAKTNGHNR